MCCAVLCCAVALEWTLAVETLSACAWKSDVIGNYVDSLFSVVRAGIQVTRMCDFLWKNGSSVAATMPSTCGCLLA